MIATENWQSRPEGGGRFALWLIRNIALYGGRRLGRVSAGDLREQTGKERDSAERQAGGRRAAGTAGGLGF